VTMMLQFPEMVADISRRRIVDRFTDPLLAEIGQGIVDHAVLAGEDIAGLITRWENPEIRAEIARLSLIEEHWDRSGCMRLINQFETSVRRRDKQLLLKRIEAAEKNGDESLLVELLQEKQHQARRTLEKQSSTNH
jgi:DNA primase